jgi:hypothetical protein
MMKIFQIADARKDPRRTSNAEGFRIACTGMCELAFVSTKASMR